MKTKKIILLGFIIVLLSSCKDYLEPWPNGNYDSETIWQYQNLVQGLINRCYDNIAEGSVGGSTRNYNNNEGVYLDGVTDDAVITSVTNVMRRYAVNSMTTSQDPFQTYWDRDYRSISQCNIFLKDRRGYNTRYIVKEAYNKQVKDRLQGEAFALRAWFEWDLLQKFGGKGTDGQMLGFPIVTDVMGVNDEINYARNTYDDCVKQIIADCDSAIKYLPLAHRNFLYPTGTDLSYLGGKYWGRFDDIATMGIKANVYLTWASPRFNPGKVVARWDSAARYAQKIINFKLTIDNIASANSFRPTDAVIFTNPNSPEIVFSTRYNTGNTAMERLFYPGGFQGNGEIGATQELVNSFGMANGRPITDPLSGYNPANPYAGRDPRFYSVIFYNTALAKRLTGGATMYTFENWNAGPTVGKDAAGTRSDNSRTNYHIKKYVYMNVNWSDATVVSAPHSRFLYRWAHFVLAFAEAANHVTHNPNTALYGLTPKAALKYLRVRKTYDNATGLSATDPYLDAQTTEAAFDALVKNERRIETCFEGMRFYDLRRWTTDDDWENVINQEVHGAYVVQTAAPSTFTYNLNWPVEERKLPSPYNPIPYNEIMRMSKLVQNEGWPSWN
ncbi:MAG: RagB/SusD family nutrient uptake outer membrane protein [Bacteroidales bacterium]|nr:RagB/SusD family nutrient uptake outer membrane protein [Bacteroidales bacterium]